MIFHPMEKRHVVKKSRFTEEQIAFALKQAELGTKVDEICRKMSISESPDPRAEGCAGTKSGSSDAVAVPTSARPGCLAQSPFSGKSAASTFTALYCPGLPAKTR
jgi:hypothetical protein